MTKEELIIKLNDLEKRTQEMDVEYYLDKEEAHILADNLLLEFINEADIAIAFNNIPKWYS